MSSRRPKPALPPEQLTVVWQSVSLLLDYPDQSVLARAELIRSASRTPADHRSATPSGPSWTTWSPPRCRSSRPTTSRPSTPAAAATCSSPTSPTATPASAGWPCCGSSRPTSHRGSSSTTPSSPTTCASSSSTPPPWTRSRGRDLMLDHRAGLELLRLSLQDMGSPWASLIDAVTATLPPLRGDERDAVRRLAAEGPPEEEVGLAPFAAPQFSPGAAATGGPRRPCCPCRPSQEHADERVPLRRRPLPLPGHLRRRSLVALPLRQVRLDHPVLPALREPAPAHRQPAVPLRDARRRRRPPHRPAGARSPGPTLWGSATTPTTWSPSPAASSPG